MIKYIYPTTIAQNDADNSELPIIQGEIDRACKELIFTNEPWHPGHLQVSDTNGNSNIIKEYNMPYLTSYINTCMNEYTQHVMGHFMKFDICQSWITKTSEGQVAASHNHGQFDIAGVYYYKTNMKDGAIKFSNPCSGAQDSRAWMQIHDVRIQPKVGTLILFPAWLDHSVDLNNTKDDRMSMAFNINIDRPIYNN